MQLLLVVGIELQVFLTLSHLPAQSNKTNAPSYVHRILLCVQHHTPGSMCIKQQRSQVVTAAGAMN